MKLCGEDLGGARGGEKNMIKIYCMQNIKLKGPAL